MKNSLNRSAGFSGLSYQQRGFTLIELMIAGLLGLILTAGMIQIFIGSSQTFRVQRAISEVLDKGRTATNFIVSEIENAGFGGDGLVASAFATMPNNVVFDAGTTDGTGAVNDSIRIQYTGIRDCTGAAVAAPFLVVNTFDVVAGELRCNGQPLINGVESFHILYGVDTDGNGFVDQYMTSTRAIALGNTTNVSAVRFEMLVASQQTRVFSENVSRDYKILDEAAVNYNDQRLRRNFSATVLLVNTP
jgi:type IV pilus assembly protein PilW